MRPFAHPVCSDYPLPDYPRVAPDYPRGGSSDRYRFVIRTRRDITVH